MMGLDVNQLANMMQTPSAERGHFQAPKRNVDRMKEKRKRKDARKARKKARKRARLARLRSRYAFAAE